MSVVSGLIVKIEKVLKILCNTINYLCFSTNNVVVNALMVLYKGRIRHTNFGDDLNYYILKELTDANIVNYQNLIHRWLRIRINNVLCIGSIVEDLCNKNSVIWGSGAMFGGEYPLKSKPKKVLAVRGPLTREYLLSNGIDCPEVYGDPALLLPKIYKPIKAKKYKIGIIPHYIDLTNNYVIEFLQRECDCVKLVNLQCYKDWHDVVDVINECEFIISSSLHGIIISDAYCVPNMWVEFSDNVRGNGFKFRDYFASVKKHILTPYRVTSNLEIDELIKYEFAWNPIDIDLSKLINSCPFRIKL